MISVKELYLQRMLNVAQITCWYTVYLIGLFFIAWSIVPSTLEPERFYNSTQILVAGIGFAVAGILGAIVVFKPLRLHGNSNWFLGVLPILILVNLNLAPSQLNRQNHKISSHKSLQLSVLSDTAPNKTIRSKQPYYELRNYLKGRDVLLNNRISLDANVLKLYAGARSVANVIIDEGRLRKECQFPGNKVPYTTVVLPTDFEINLPVSTGDFTVITADPERINAFLALSCDSRVGEQE